MSKKYILLVATVIALLSIVPVSIAQGVSNVGSRWAAGDLVFYKVSNGDELLTIGVSGINIPALSLAGTAVNATATELNQYSLNAQFADAGTAGSVYVVAPHAGTLKSISIVNHANSTTTKTVFTSSIAGNAVTHAALEIAATATAGTASTIAPSAANTVAAGNVIIVTSDGGTDATMPASVTLVVER